MRFIAGLLVLLFVGCAPELEQKPSPEVSRTLEPEHLSLVLLYRKHEALDLASIQPKLVELLGPDTNLEELGDSKVRISGDGWEFLCVNVNQPYFTSENQIENAVSEPRLQESLRTCEAYRAIRVTKVPEGWEIRQGYPYLGRVTLALSSYWCLFIYSPELEKVQLYDPKSKSSLESGLPLLAFTKVRKPMSLVKANDPEMEAAYDKARETWSDFLDYLNEPEGREFAVLKKFIQGDKWEYTWIYVQEVRDGTIYGMAGSSPYFLTNYERGDPVEMKVAEIYDWAVIEGDNIHGAFTEDVKERRREYEAQTGNSTY